MNSTANRLPDSPATADDGQAGPVGTPRLGLVLTGGGARCAYQVGVLKAVAELVPRDAPIPFRVISGTSAGAIIAATLAANAERFREGAVSLERFWRNFRVDQVFRADTSTMLRAGLHWMLALVTGGLLVRPPESVFDVAPLRDTLARHVDFDRVRAALAGGDLDALAINASAYRSALTVAFFECARGTPPWLHTWRVGQPAELGPDHLLASAAVPFLFPAVALAGEYYGDGAMRQVAPLSPAINLGAERLLIIGVRPSGRPPVTPPGNGRGPSFGQLFGFMLDTLFMDGIQTDLERLHRENLLVEAAGHATGSGGKRLRRIGALLFTPREDFGAIAQRHAHEVPRAVRVLLRTMGAANPGGRTLLSYMLFERGYTRELIALGYRDAMERRAELAAFVGLDGAVHDERAARRG